MKIICIGRNYVEHIQEMNSEQLVDPVYFMKPDTALLQKGKDFYLPDFSKDIHHEVELVVKVCKEGKNISEEFASRYFDQITVGIDITARDLQNRCKDKGLPWEIAKSFDNSAPVGDFIPFTEIKKKDEIAFELKINGSTVQQGTSKMMIHSFEKIISYVSRFITIRKGDLIYTGTPKGVGALKPGDKLEAFLEGNKMLEFSVR